MAYEYFATQINYGPGPVTDTVQVQIITRWHKPPNQLKMFVELLKATIPASNRMYDPASKIWTVTAQAFNSLKMVMDALKIQSQQYPSGLGLEAAKTIDPNNFFHNPTPAPAVETKESLKAKLEKLLDSTIDIAFMSDGELKKLYRRKAMELHPDRNNEDGSKMSELNSIWSAYNATS
jgi:hypothetical protein